MLPERQRLTNAAQGFLGLNNFNSDDTMSRSKAFPVRVMSDRPQLLS